MVEFRLKNGCFSTNTNKKYINIKCKKEGIQIDFSDEVKKGYICYRIDRGINAKIVLPKRIRDAYILPVNYSIPKNLKENYFIPAERKNKVKPLCISSDDNFFFDENNIINKKVVKAEYYKIPFNAFKGETCKVTVYYGNKNFIIISQADKTDNIPTYEALKKEYGNNLYLYPYSKIEYLVDNKNGSINIPTIFFREWNQYEKVFEVERFKMCDNSYVIAPINRTCFIDEKEIDLKKEPVLTKKVCSTCSEDNDDLREIINLIKDIGAAISEVKKQSLNLEGRIKKLENTVKTPQ